MKIYCFNIFFCQKKYIKQAKYELNSSSNELQVSLPRVRDFRGVSDKGFDGRGNYSMGIIEQIIFPEIDIDKVSRINGMDVTFVTTAKTDVECHSLLTELGLPFIKN